jgi:hypothetical protein
VHVTSTQFLVAIVHATAFSAPHSIMEEGCSSVYAVSDELDESSLSSESELEVEQPSQCAPGGPAGPIVTLLECLKSPTWHELLPSGYLHVE